MQYVRTSLKCDLLLTKDMGWSLKSEPPAAYLPYRTSCAIMTTYRLGSLAAHSAPTPAYGQKGNCSQASQEKLGDLGSKSRTLLDLACTT